MREQINKLINSVKPIMTNIDAKLTGLIPDQKLRKFIYISFGSIAGIFIFLMLLAIILSPFGVNSNQNEFLVKKPDVKQGEDKKEMVLTENQKTIKNYELQIKNLKFPESQISPPIIQFELTITDKKF
jgi:hypothetical protein